MKRKSSREEEQVQRGEDRLGAEAAAEPDTAVDEVCRKMGMCEATFGLWRKKYQNLNSSGGEAAPEVENRKLKQRVGDLRLDKAMLQAELMKRFGANAEL